MTVQELIEKLQNYSDDALVCFYDCLRGDDMCMRDISVSDENDEIYFNIHR